MIMSSMPHWGTGIGYYIYNTKKLNKNIDKGVGVPDWGSKETTPIDLHYTKPTPYCRCPECVALEKRSKTHHVYC